MSRKSSLILVSLLIITLIFAGCGRYGETGNDTDDKPPEVSETTDAAESDADREKEQIAREPVPFAISRGFELVYGYMDQEGNVLIEPQSGSAEPFYACGLAIAADTNGKFGLIDKTGRFVVSPEWDEMRHSEDVFIGTRYSGDIMSSRAFDETGASLFDKPYIDDFSDGLTMFYDGKFRGYKDKTGLMVLEVPYERIENFKDGVAEVAMEYSGPSILIDKQENDLTDTVSSGLRMIRDEQSGRFGFEDKNGNVVIEPRFYSATPFRDGFSIVSVPGSDSLVYGIIDTQGNFVLAPEYSSIKRMRNGSFAVGVKPPEGAIDSWMYASYSRKALYSRDLKKHTDWIFVDVEDFHSSYTCVTDGERIYYLDADLNRAADMPEFSGLGIMLADGELLRGTINDQLTVADRSGNILARDEKPVYFENGGMSKTVTRYLGDYTTVTYPVFEGFDDTALQERLNRIIEEKVNGYVGKDTSYGENPYNFAVTYVRCSVNIIKNLMHIEIRNEEYWPGAAHPLYVWSNEYINILNGEEYTLNDLFRSPSEGRQRLSEIVNRTIEESEDMMYEYYSTVYPDQFFWFRLEGDGITVYSDVYEIAPYAAGMPEFHIPYSEIMDLIDTQGNFWKSFN